MEQGGAVDAEGLSGAGEVAVADVQDDAAGRMGAAEDVVDGLGEGGDGVGQAQAVEDAEAGRLQHEAGADGLRLVEAFMDNDAAALAGQHQGDGEP